MTEENIKLFDSELKVMDVLVDGEKITEVGKQNISQNLQNVEVTTDA